MQITFVLLVALFAYPQQEKIRLTIEQAVAKADKFPSIEASEEQVNAAAAGIRIARNNYLPNVNAMAQVNRATRKNVFGLLLPQSSVVTTTERVFVVGDKSGRADWVSVRKGPSAGTEMEVESDGLKPGDEVVERATDEMREGSRL